MRNSKEKSTINLQSPLSNSQKSITQSSLMRIRDDSVRELFVREPGSDTNNNYLQDLIDKGPRFLSSEIIQIQNEEKDGELFTNS